MVDVADERGDDPELRHGGQLADGVVEILVRREQLDVGDHEIEVVAVLKKALPSAPDAHKLLLDHPAERGADARLHAVVGERPDHERRLPQQQRAHEPEEHERGQQHQRHRGELNRERRQIVEEPVPPRLRARAGGRELG